MDYSLSAEIDDLFRVIAERGNEEPVLGIERKVVDSSLYICQGNGAGQDQGSGGWGA